MEKASDFTVFSPDEVAAILKIDRNAVLREFASGRLKGFQVGNEWRTTPEFLREMLTTPADVSPPPTTTPSVRREIPTMQQFREMMWKATEPFTYQWPHRADAEEAESQEHYEEAYSCMVPVDGQERSFVIGFCDRPAAGIPDRRRAVVFQGTPGQTLYPVVEFTGANDFATSGRMASLVRQGRKTVRPGEALPAGYEDMPTGIYNEIVVGPNAWNAVAVVVHQTDFPVMIRHAVLRSAGGR